MKHIPNAITALRLILLFPFIIILLNDKFIVALILYLIMEALDKLDGKIAHWFGISTKIGVFWDAFVDSMTHMTAFIFFFAAGGLHIMLLLVIIWREFTIIFLRLTSLLVNEPIGSLMIGKAKALIHAATIAYALWVLHSKDGDNLFLKIMFYISAGASIVSGVVYIYKGRAVLKKAFI